MPSQLAYVDSFNSAGPTSTLNNLILFLSSVAELSSVVEPRWEDVDVGGATAIQQRHPHL